MCELLFTIVLDRATMKTEAEIRDAVSALLPARDWQNSGVTLGRFRSELEQHFSLPPGALEPQKDLIGEIIKEIIEAETQPHANNDELQVQSTKLRESPERRVCRLC